MTSQRIRAIFERLQQAFVSKDSVAVVADYADDCTLESPSYGRVTGREAVENVYRNWFRTFPDFRAEFPDLVIAGDHVVSTLIIEGTDTGGFLGQAPTGRPFRLFVVFLYTFDNGKILYERRVYDVTGLLLQLAGGADNADMVQAYRARLEGARLEHDLRIAAVIQQTLLPERRYEDLKFDVATASVPCRAIGGDFCDHFGLPNEAFGFALGDVTGKGPPAALLAAQLQGILAAYSQLVATAAELVTRVNEVLGRRVVESRFATMFFGRLSPDGLLTYSNAGHNPPVLLRGTGSRLLETGGLVLGAFNDVVYQEETIQLEDGDVLVIFSDGVTEAMNPEGAEFGEERLLSCVSAHRDAAATDLLDSLLGTVREFTAGASQSDDITAMVLRYGPQP